MCVCERERERVSEWEIGLGTDLGTFKGAYRFASVLPSIDSH